MKLISINKENSKDISFDNNTPEENIEKLLSSISEDTDIIITSGANEAVLSFLLKTGKYSDSFKRIKTLHILDENEAVTSYPVDGIKFYLSNDSLVRRNDREFYPSESAVIYSDRIIIKNRRSINYGDPMFNHYLMQFAFKIYEMPTYDTENCLSVCKRLFRFE